MAGYDTPEYRAYREGVKGGSMKLPMWDETQIVTILPGELYCRVAFCGHTNVPMSSTNNLRKHIQHAHPHISLTPGKNGKVPNSDIMNANRFYSSLNNGNSSPEPSDLSTVHSSPHPVPAHTTPIRKAPPRKASARKTPACSHSPEALLPMPMINSEIDAAGVRKVGIQKSGKRAPCPNCRKNKTTCGSTEVCIYWEYFDVEGGDVDGNTEEDGSEVDGEENDTEEDNN